MREIWTNRWTLLVAANVLFCCVLSFYQPHDAAAQGAREPFGNSVAQRDAMIAQLKEINEQLKEQNALLRSGKLQVVVGQ